MNDLKFGFVEIDTSREINRCRLEIDRVLFRKKFMDFWRRYGQILAKKIEGQKCMKNANNVAR